MPIPRPGILGYKASHGGSKVICGHFRGCGYIVDLYRFYAGPRRYTAGGHAARSEAFVATVVLHLLTL
jgi:hypothetical protein